MTKQSDYPERKETAPKQKHTPGPITKEMVEALETKPVQDGICPLCGSTDIEYSATEFEDGQNYQECGCCNCDLNYQEWQSDEVEYIHIHRQMMENGDEIDEIDRETKTGKIRAAAPEMLESLKEFANADDVSFGHPNYISKSEITRRCCHLIASIEGKE